jgi:hypothetical protein
MESDLIFFDHQAEEKKFHFSSSVCNEFEAEMIVNLAYYLNQNGYDRKRISILTLYMKQALIIKKRI